jgi:ribonuclease T2
MARPAVRLDELPDISAAHRPIMNTGSRVLISVFLALVSVSAKADGTPGQFDFYLLSLSWSPTYCLSQGERANRTQCGSAKPKAFVVHGLWPQYDDGYPQHCRTHHPSHVPASLVETALDLMPSAGLIGSQWRKHGTCSGLSQSEYLAEVRRAYKKIDIPDLFEDAQQRHVLSARNVEQAFLEVNPGLSANGIAVSCKKGRVAEVRICLTRSLEFRRCENVDRNGCRASRLVMPSDR